MNLILNTINKASINIMNDKKSEKYNNLKVLCIGDIVGSGGVDTASLYLDRNSEKYDFVIANIENSNPKGGRGLTRYAFDKLTERDVSVFTGGNHSFDNKLSYDLYEKNNVLRPCNFPSKTLGRGYFVTCYEDKKIVVINVQLRVFMREHLGCPFRSVESILSLYNEPDVITIIDLHGEATSEKLSFGAYFDGKVSAIFGTHTHVQTADARIMPKGTGYITDVGMVGAHHSSLGVKFEKTIYNFIHQTPVLFELEKENPHVFSAIEFDIDMKSKKCDSLQRVYELIDL